MEAPEPRFGIVDLLWATVVSSVIAMLIAVLLGVAVALFITQYSPSLLARPAATVIDLLAAVPGIALRFLGLNIAGQYVEPVAIFLQKDPRPATHSSRSAGISAKSTLFFAGIIPADHDPADHHGHLPRGLRLWSPRPTRRAPSPSARPSGK